MVWGLQDAGLADLSVLPRAGMPKPPHLENWGDLTDHSSSASIRPRSSSPREGFWAADTAVRDGRPKSAKLQSSLVADEETCERLGFRPGAIVRTPAGRVARIVGAIQTDQNNSDSWRLWAEYVDKDGGRIRTEGLSAREQVTAPGTPSSTSSSQPGSCGKSSGGSTWSPLRSGISPGSPGNPCSPRRRRARRPPNKTSLVGEEDRSARSDSPLGPFTRSPTPNERRLDVMRPQSLLVDEVSEPCGHKPHPPFIEDREEEPLMTAHGFMLPARPIGAKAHRSHNVSTPTMTFERDASPYLEEVKSVKYADFGPADYSCFADVDELREGQLVWTPCGTVAKVTGKLVIPRLHDPYDKQCARSNAFSALHHSQISGAGDENSRTRIILRKVSPSEVRRRCSAEFPMERSLKDSTWPREPAAGAAFGYSGVTDLETLKCRLQQCRRRQGDAYVNRFTAESPPAWSPANARSRKEEYLSHTGKVLYRGTRLSSSPAAIATRCGYGPQTEVGLQTPLLEASMATKILSNRRQPIYSPVDWRSCRGRTNGWSKAMFDPSSRPHTVRYDHTY